jgi:hypothetical protein
VVIRYLYLLSITIVPTKADAPLIVDPDAPLSASVTGQLFQFIAWRNAQEVKGCSSVELP